MGACPCQMCSGSAGSRGSTIHRPWDLHRAHGPFLPLCFSETFVCCCSLGKIQRVHHLQGLHTPCSHSYHPQALVKNCSLIVLGMGDTLIQVACRWNWEGHEGLNMELYQKSCTLGPSFIGSGFFSGVSAEVLKAGWLLGSPWN